MQQVPALKLLLWLFVAGIAASAAHGFNCCRAADVVPDGVVNEEDLAEIDRCMGQFDPRKDLNGDGVVNGDDRKLVEGFQNVDCSSYCRADLNFDGYVDELDLSPILESFGQVCRELPECPPYDFSCARLKCRIADLNKNGRVEIHDRWFLQAEWGPCPGSVRAANGIGIPPNPCAEDPEE